MYKNALTFGILSLLALGIWLKDNTWKSDLAWKEITLTDSFSYHPHAVKRAEHYTYTHFNGDIYQINQVLKKSLDHELVMNLKSGDQVLLTYYKKSKINELVQIQEIESRKELLIQKRYENQNQTDDMFFITAAFYLGLIGLSFFMASFYADE